MKITFTITATSVKNLYEAVTQMQNHTNYVPTLVTAVGEIDVPDDLSPYTIMDWARLPGIKVRIDADEQA